MPCRTIFPSLLALTLLFGGALRLQAQDMEPRAYSNAPIGTNFVIGAYSYSTGEVSIDPSIPITDVDADIDSFTAGYSRFFSFFGRTASVAVAVPYVDAHVTGNVQEEAREVNRQGLGDMRLRFGVNLIGGPAMTPEEFKQRIPETTLGASLSVVAPTGEYTSRYLINIGANRWAFKPGIGIAHPIGNWFVEGLAGAWIFADNDSFYRNT